MGQESVYTGSEDPRGDAFGAIHNKKNVKCKRVNGNPAFASKMLVGYSSSSEDENETATDEKRPTEEDDGCSARKKPKTQDEVPKTRFIICFSNCPKTSFNKRNFV